MQKHFDAVQDRSGNAIAGASVRVTITSSGTLATIYSDNGITPTANPLTTNSDGEFSFYAANGRYTLTTTHASFGSDAVADVVLYDPAQGVPTSDVVEKGFWADQGSGANIHRLRDRLLVGDACDYNGNLSPGSNKSWLGFEASGNMTYFESRSQFEVAQTKGGIAGAFGSRSSDNTLTGERNTIGVGAYATNDNTNAADKKSAWAFYGHAFQAQANQFTTAMELDVCSVQTLVDVTPYSMSGAGATACAWLGVGGETAQGLVSGGSGATLTNVSCALGIINSASSAANNQYSKGIVFQSNSITGTDGSTGTGVAMEMAKGHELKWRFSAGANAFGGTIRSDCAAAATQQRIVFNTATFQVRGVKSDLTTEVNLLTVGAPTITGSNDTNYIHIQPGQTGGGTASVQAAGIDTNIDLQISPKGTGLVRIGVATTAASSPAAFAANRILAFKDSSGTTYYIPCMGATW